MEAAAECWLGGVGKSVCEAVFFGDSAVLVSSPGISSETESTSVSSHIFRSFGLKE